MIFIEEKFYKIWLSLINGLGIKKYFILVNIFKSNKKIFKASKNELLQIKGLNSNIIYDLLDESKKILAKKHLKYMELNNIDIISIQDSFYPKSLKEIFDPPLFLYIKGNKEIFNNLNIGMVGSRNCSIYGKNIAQKLAYDLSSFNVNIVSGLARGIDTFSHTGALLAKGLTTAVLGSGLDIIYPKENLYLENKILNTNGAILTEYPLGNGPNKLHFPARNRIISGISRGVVIVEAKTKSGSLITANFALEQGKDVFAVPRKH